MEATVEEVQLAKYPAYKESGVNWLGEIPAHWNIVRSKALFQQRREQARREDQQLTASQKYGIISQQEFMELEGRRVTQVEFNRDILKHIEANDFVVSMRSFQGGIEYSSHSGCVSSAYVPLIPIKHVVPEYFKYLFKSDAYIKALSSTSNLVRDGQALRFENFSQVDLVIVPEEEQTAIAQFLDRKTAQVDKAIGIKEKQIELLKERRQVLIHNAVTRGLNTDVPMKDSGVEWIGEIPAHWEMRKLKQILNEKRKTSNPTLSSGSISYGKVVMKDDDKIPYSTKASYQEVLKGEFLINPLNLNYDLISLRIALSKIDVVVSPGYIVLTNTIEIHKEFYMYFLHRYDVAFMKLLGSGVRQTISFNHIGNSLLVFPPLEEQRAIAEFLNRTESKIDFAITIKYQEIAKLKEYKATLINSAVTGKIKVI
jgi:type I restriction enzyme, S subunit